jgi:hypothetical protein
MDITLTSSRSFDYALDIIFRQPLKFKLFHVREESKYYYVCPSSKIFLASDIMYTSESCFSQYFAKVFAQLDIKSFIEAESFFYNIYFRTHESIRNQTIEPILIRPAKDDSGQYSEIEAFYRKPSITTLLGYFESMKDLLTYIREENNDLMIN